MLNFTTLKPIRYKYNIINAYGNQEAWTGIFPNEKKAQEWYEKFGSKHEAKGYKLVKVIVKDEEE